MTAAIGAFGRDRDEIRRQDYSLGDEQRDIRDSFARFFERQCPSELVRAAEPLGFDADLWRRTAELGAAAMRLAEERGGVGGSLVDLALIAEQAGGRAAPLPLAEAAVALPLLALAADPGAEARLAAAVAGELVPTLAPRPLDGRPQLLPAGAVAGAVVALDGEELVLFELERPGEHVRNLGGTPLALWSPERAGDRVVLAGGEAAAAAHAGAVAEWRLLTAAALVGAGARAIVEAVEFAKTRLTSKVPIGSLQAVSHPLVDAEALVASARHLVWKAAWFRDEEPGARPELAPMAFAHASRAASVATATALHMQGGFGFTLESDVTLYFRRAKGWSVLGDPRGALAAVGALLDRREEVGEWTSAASS